MTMIQKPTMTHLPQGSMQKAVDLHYDNIAALDHPERAVGLACLQPAAKMDPAVHPDVIRYSSSDPNVHALDRPERAVGHPYLQPMIVLRR